MSMTVLLTAAVEDVKPIADDFEKLSDLDVQHIPLEKYTPLSKTEDRDSVLEKIDTFENIVHGNPRNTKFFVQAIEQRDKIEKVRQALNVTLDENSAEMLENIGIPAVTVQEGKKPIDLVEFLLRLRRLGPTLYPCGTHLSEDTPALLQELDIPVTELELFELQGPDQEELAGYQQQIKSQPPDILVFHSRRSVIRTLTAFPDLNFGKTTIVAADRAVTEKLKDKNITTDIQAEGSWNSVLQKISALD